MRILMLLSLWCALLAGGHLRAADAPPLSQAEDALRKAVEFFDRQVSIQGGYLWQYSHDLRLREGEGEATATTAWVQPPGTPTVGQALLQAYRLTGKSYLLDAARRTALALVQGQLLSGGWDYRIEFDAATRTKYAYRKEGGGPEARNTTTYDDDTTQAALRFLMEIDRELQFAEPAIHEAAEFGLQAVLKAQYPNGAWPQRYSQFPDPARFPVRQADYPPSWSRTYPGDDYREYYTFNDDALADVIRTLFDAAAIYGKPEYRAAAERGGDFILLAQMPEPQPAWAQQYNRDMQPAWARKFEPPSVTGGESQGVLRILLEIYQRTGNKKYLEPFPRALQYLKRSQLPDGRLARFYELQTNRPLYFTKDYQLTYSSQDMPTHYAFIVGSSVTGLESAYQRALTTTPPLAEPSEKSPAIRKTTAVARAAAEAIDQLDERGAWVEPGSLKSYPDVAPPVTRVITCRTFVDHVGALSRYLAAR